MARGNWRSNDKTGTGPAEVGSARKMIDGFVMKKSGSFATEKEALFSATILEKEGYKTGVVKGRKYWNVWRMIRKGQKRLL